MSEPAVGRSSSSRAPKEVSRDEVRIVLVKPTMLGGEEAAWEGVPPQPLGLGGGSVLSTEQTALLERLRAGGRQPAAEEAPADGGHVEAPAGGRDDSRPAAAEEIVLGEEGWTLESLAAVGPAELDQLATAAGMTKLETMRLKHKVDSHRFGQRSARKSAAAAARASAPSRGEPEPLPVTVDISNTFFCAVFCFELALRLFVHRKDYFTMDRMLCNWS